ncbi:LysM peptidoglycan-binding domain-containing protein [Kineococcus sp. LSe6-4]|uniref:LysM peptidoglycan-binding domain-containing protein n=1 Tax=Kineococcus halophytocola TaxID=3234027 RepID=A0ABV4GXM8_9ACTN
MADETTDTPTPSSRRGRWLAAALVGAAAPTALVPAAHAAAAPGETVVTVQAGDTVGAIAAAHGTTVEAVVAANGLGQDAFVLEGRQLRVPGPQSTSAGGSYTVQDGDTLSHIALAQGTTVGALREANGLSAGGVIRAGQVLTLPGAAPSSASSSASSSGTPSGGGTHTVRAGDTLSHIAQATGTSVVDLVALNGLDETGFIVEGQTLRTGTAERAAQPARPSTQAPTVSDAVSVNRARIQASDQPGKAEMREIIRSTAVRLGVDPSLALAVGMQESGFQMKVVSHANAIGAMQVIPTSGEWASNLLGEPIDLFDARDNAKAGVAILRTLVANNPPDVAIASYYQGQASVRSRGMYDDTRRYVANVQTLQARFR